MFNKLVKNELTKQFKKSGVGLLTVIVLALSIASPLVIKYLDDKENATINLMETEYTMGVIDEQLAKPQNTEAEKVTHIVYNARKYNLLLAQEIERETLDWRNELMDLHLRASINRGLILGMINGIEYEDIKLNAENYDYYLFESLANATIDELNLQVDYFDNQIEEYEEIIRNNDYISGVQVYIQELDKEIEIQNRSIEQLKTEVQDEETALEIKSKERMIALYEGEKEILQIRIDRQIPYDDNDWKSLTIDKMVFYNTAVNEIAMSESEFYLYGFKDMEVYEEYLDITNKKINDRKASLVELTHSLEIGEPAYDLLTDSRVSTYISIELSVIAITLLLIFMGSGMMSSEFSKGTIRMLVARPVKRQSIFFAKLVALVIVGLGLLIVSALLSIITSGLAFGFSDFTFKVTNAIDGIVYSQNYFVFLFLEIVVTLGGMALVIALLVTLSTITRSAIFSLGFTMMLYMLSAPIGALFISSSIVRNSVLPYMNIGMIRLVPDLNNSVWGMGYDLNLTLGAIALVAIAIAISLIGCIVFVKKDIRN